MKGKMSSLSMPAPVMGGKLGWHVPPMCIHASHQATPADQGFVTRFAMVFICHRSIQKETAAQEKAAQAVVAKAKAMAIALQTIGKFVIRKKVGESNQIFGRWAILRPRMQAQGREVIVGMD